MTLNLSCYQNNLFEKFKSSLGGHFSDLKSNLSGIDWVERSVSAARYTAELANKDAWLAMCDAFSAISTVVNALYQAEQAQQSSYHAMNESLVASSQAWQAETEAMHAERMAAQSEFSEIRQEQMITYSEGKKAMSEAALNVIQKNNVNIQSMIIPTVNTTNKKQENISLIEVEEATNKQSNQQKTNNEKENNITQKSSQSKEEINKSETKKEEAKTSKVENVQKQQTQEGIKVDTTKQKDHANLQALKSQEISINARNVISNAELIKENADNRNFNALNTKFEANNQTDYSEIRRNEYHFEIKNITNITNHLNNLIELMQKSNTKQPGSDISTEAKNKLEQITAIKTTVESFGNDEKPENKEEINAYMLQTQDAIKTLTFEAIQNKSIPVILDKNLSEYKDIFGNKMNHYNVKIDERNDDRRSQNDRRETSEEMFNFNERKDISGRRNNPRRTEDLTKALFIKDKELIEFLT